jgi:hypothetical protein
LNQAERCGIQITMKTSVAFLACVAAAGLFLLPTPEAEAGVSVRVNVGTPYGPAYCGPRYVQYAQPVYVTPATGYYYSPAPVVYSAPVIVTPAPLYYGRPVYYRSSYYGGRYCR